MTREQMRLVREIGERERAGVGVGSREITGEKGDSGKEKGDKERGDKGKEKEKDKDKGSDGEADLMRGDNVPEWFKADCHALPGGDVIVRESDWGSVIAHTLR